MTRMNRVELLSRIADIRRAMPHNRMVGELLDDVEARIMEAKVGRPTVGSENLSIERSKPWEAEGISRRTWYRRKRVKATSHA